MANSVGGLIVTLGLNAVDYVQGLTKAEYQAKKFAQNTRAAILEVGKVLGTLAIGDAVFEATKAIIAEAAALDDLADSTGASVEALSQLSNQAKIAGTDFATLQTAILKLSAGMAGTDEETTKAKEALKLLGVTTKDPAKAMQEIAVALDKFEDGVNKVAIAVALFGKGGAALLPLLKDMAQLQDVQATVTTKQAAEAEALEKAWRRLAVESTTFKTAILTNVVPPLLQAITAFNDASKSGLGFFQAMQDVANLNPFLNVFESVENAQKAVDKLKAGIADPTFLGMKFGTGQLEKELVSAQRVLALAKASRDRVILQGQGDNADQVSRRFLGKPEAPALSGAGAGRAKALKEQTTEAQRYLETLEKQNERTLELTHTEQFLRDVQMDRIKGLTPALTDQILKQTQLLDSNEALKKSEEERKKAAEEAAKAQERIAEATKSAIKSAMQEVEAIKQGNDQLREQIVFLKGGEEAVNRMTDAKLAGVIADKEAEVAARRVLDANDMWVAQIDEQIRLLKERQGLIGQMRLAEKMREEAVALQEVKNLMSDALVDPLTDFITGAKSAKEAFRDLVNDITRQISRIASQNIANAIFGGKSGGPDIFGALAKLAASAFTGSSSTSFSGGGFGEHFASGGISRGGLAMVGEAGPEIVNLPRGAQVIPIDQAKRAGSNVTVNISVPGGTSRASADQIATQAGIAVSRAMRRNA